jgi:hypothetical protein
MTTTKKKPVAKKTVVKAKSTVTKAPAKKAPKVSEPRSFRQTAEPTPFLTFKPTIQSVYWLVLGIVVVALGAWVMYLNVQVQEIYDQIDMNTSMIDMPVEKQAKKSN